MKKTGTICFMSIAIIGHGDWFNCAAQLQHYQVVIAADGGANYCQRLGIIPTQMVGDGDSIDSAIAFSPDPDQTTTDLQKALVIAKTYLTDSNEVVDLFCVTSHNRLDHTLAAVQLLANDQCLGTIYTPYQRVMCVRNTLQLTEPVGAVVSLLPFTPSTTVRLEGFKWSAEEIELTNQRSGISNVISSSPATIHCLHGTVIMLLPAL